MRPSSPSSSPAVPGRTCAPPERRPSPSTGTAPATPSSTSPADGEGPPSRSGRLTCPDGPPAGRRVLTHPAVHGLTEQVGVPGVPAVLLEEVAEEPAEAGVPAVGHRH